MQVSAAPHHNPGRAPVAAYALVVPVAIGAALASTAVRSFIARTGAWAEGDGSARWSYPTIAIIALVLAGLVAARALGGLARQKDPAGNDVSWALTGHDRSPWRSASIRRIVGTIVAAIGLAPIGREVAVLELGALVGDTTVRGRQGSRRLAAVGVAAAFTAAYHAPLAAIVFVVEHLVWSRFSGPERHRAAARLTPWAGAGALIGHLTALVLLGDRPLLSPPGPVETATVVLAAVLAVPVTLVVGRFAPTRARMAEWAASARSPRSSARPAMLLSATAVLVGLFPLVSGNGLESLRTAATGVSIGTAAVIVVGRLLATSATLAAGVPGGVFSPSLALAGGTAALILAMVDRVGIELGAHRWDAVLLVSAVGVAVSLRSPFVAALVVPEMTGQIALVPVCGMVVAVAWLTASATAEGFRPGAWCCGRCGPAVR